MRYHCGLERTCNKSSNCNCCMNYYALVWENEIKFKYALRDKNVVTTCPGLMITPPLEAKGNSGLESIIASNP